MSDPKDPTHKPPYWPWPIYEAPQEGALRHPEDPTVPPPPPPPTPTVEQLQADLTKLKREADELDERLQLALAANTDLRNELKAKDAVMLELKNAADGLRAWLKQRGDSVQAMPLGTKVKLGAGTCLYNGTVLAVHIDRAGVSYDVVWWAHGQRHQALLGPDELVLNQDDLLVPPKSLLVSE